MFYRRSGILHTSYEEDLEVFPIPFEKTMILVLFAGALSTPLWLSELYLTSYLMPWLLWVSVTLSLNLLMGWAGQIHLGFGAVMAIGAYSSIHLVQFGVPFLLALLGAGLLSALIGLIFGGAALRAKGLYLAVATLALQFLIQWMIVHVPGISGGYSETLQAPFPRVLGWTLQSNAGLFYVALGWCVVVTVFMWNLTRSSLGRSFIALREKDYAASMIGINVFKGKLMAFLVSSFLGGVSGAVMAFTYFRAVTPAQYSFDVSIQVLAMVLVGGLASIMGSYLGAAFIFSAPILLNQWIGWISEVSTLQLSLNIRSHIPIMVYGALIVLFLLIEPLGLGKMYDNVRKYFLLWPFSQTKR